jgi:hypothetical protein
VLVTSALAMCLVMSDWLEEPSGNYTLGLGSYVMIGAVLVGQASPLLASG